MDLATCRAVLIHLWISIPFLFSVYMGWVGVYPTTWLLTQISDWFRGGPLPRPGQSETGSIMLGILLALLGGKYAFLSSGFTSEEM